MSRVMADEVLTLRELAGCALMLIGMSSMSVHILSWHVIKICHRVHIHSQVP